MFPQFPQPKMIAELINLSTKVNETQCRLMLAGCAYQMNMHYSPAWGEVPLGVNYFGSSMDDVNKVPSNRATVLLMDNSDAEQGVLGYHTELADKLVVKVFVQPVLDAGGSVLGDPNNLSQYCVSSTLSHELLELAGDPYVNWWADGPSTTQGSQYSFELCDPVEGTQYAVSVSDPDSAGRAAHVIVSDFVLSSWFDPQSTKGPWSYCNSAPGPFQLAPNSYMVVRSGGPGTEQQIFADRATYPQWKLDTKKSKLSRTYKRGIVNV